MGKNSTQVGVDVEQTLSLFAAKNYPEALKGLKIDAKLLMSDIVTQSLQEIFTSCKNHQTIE